MRHPRRRRLTESERLEVRSRARSERLRVFRKVELAKMRWREYRRDVRERVDRELVGVGKVTVRVAGEHETTHRFCVDPQLASAACRAGGATKAPGERRPRVRRSAGSRSSSSVPSSDPDSDGGDCEPGLGAGRSHVAEAPKPPAIYSFACLPRSERE